MLLGVLLLIYPHADSGRFPGLRRTVSPPRFTIFVRIVHSAAKQHACVVHVFIFYSPKNAFAHRYDASTPGGAGEGRSGRGVITATLDKEKKHYNNTQIACNIRIYVI